MYRMNECKRYTTREINMTEILIIITATEDIVDQQRLREVMFLAIIM